LEQGEKGREIGKGGRNYGRDFCKKAPGVNKTRQGNKKTGGIKKRGGLVINPQRKKKKKKTSQRLLAVNGPLRGEK